VVYSLPKAITMSQLTKDQICTELGISPRCLENMIRRGEFPPPARLGKRNVWTDRALQAWRQRFFHAQEMWMPGNA
jgi:predicted DNA-binding transcriptional regulator AlpA